MSLRVKLLLVSLMTLILPWAGWQYAQRMETTLRHGQEESLITTADVLSRVVASQPELLYRFPDELSDDFDPARGDLFAPLLSTTPLLDGFADEWPIPSRPVAGFDDGSGLRLGLFGRYLYAYFDVRDANVAYEDPSSESRGESATSRVIFLTRDEFDRERAWSVSAIAPGPIIARPSDVGAPWRSSPDQIQHVTGVWRATARGYAIELRVPVSMFGKQLTVFALDRQGRTGATPTLGRLHIASDALRERLEQYTPRGLRVSVVDRRGWLLARAGSVEISSASYARQNEDGFARSIYRQLFGGRDAIAVSYGLPYGMWGAPVDAARDGKNEAIWFEPAGGEPSLVRAAVPVHAGDQTLAALVVEQPAEQLAVVREDALTRLLNLTLLATLFSVVITLAFAARLSQRIRRLSRAVASAMTPEGRLEPRIPDTQARDELGTLARNYSTLLGRLKEHTSYLQTLGTKLSHELRTPLTIVSSSLDNLASDESLPEVTQSYLDRARTGAGRLHAILTAMTEANRVEQIIDHTERIEFDLADLVRNIGQAYSSTFAQVHVETHVPQRRCSFTGSPDLIAQMLDKLMDNAADFCPPGGTIRLELERHIHDYVLSLSNDGPLLPPHLDGRLFESLVSARTQPDSKPHLGLGLYIVRLIAEAHNGTATAENHPDGRGVRMMVRLPLTDMRMDT